MAVVVSPFLAPCVLPCGGGGSFHPLSPSLCLLGLDSVLFWAPVGLWFVLHSSLCPIVCLSKDLDAFSSLRGVWPYSFSLYMSLSSLYVGVSGFGSCPSYTGRRAPPQAPSPPPRPVLPAVPLGPRVPSVQGPCSEGLGLGLLGVRGSGETGPTGLSTPRTGVPADLVDSCTACPLLPLAPTDTHTRVWAREKGRPVQ